MKRNESPSKPVSSSSSRRHRYRKVLDARKHAVRGLWQRNGGFYARITVEDGCGRKSVKWHPLDKATTASKAQDELRDLLVKRKEGRLPKIGLSPLFQDYAQTYKERLDTSGKKPDSVTTEKIHINQWVEVIGQIRLAKIRPHHINNQLHALRKAGRAARTCNLALVYLRNVLESARIDEHIVTSPADRLPWFPTEKKAHRLYAPDEIDRLCAAAVAPKYIKSRLATEGERGACLKNGVQFADYLRFLQYSGAREAEALRVCKADVDMERGHVMIGADGDAKNRDHRAVDLNPQLRSLLEDMAKREAPDTKWLFPSPQRGEKDEHAKTFRESLALARDAAGLPEFGFHDLRRFFASRAVMSGIDVLTISRWLGHKDGGLLLLKRYAHLADEHRKAQAQRIVFAPQLLNTASV